MKLRWTVRAQTHLQGVYNWIFRDSPRAAASVLRRIRQSVGFLAEFPEAGHAGHVGGTLEWVVHGLPYIIVYEVNQHADELWILGVFHGAQDRDEV